MITGFEACSRRRLRRLVLIMDLPAIVPASHASKRRAELFAVNLCLQRCKLVFAGHSAATAENRCNEAGIEIRQARPKSTSEVLRQRMIGMLLVLGSTANLVHVANCMPRGAF